MATFSPAASKTVEPFYLCKYFTPFSCIGEKKSNLSITDGVYGVLSSTDTKGEIAKLGKKAVSSELVEVEELKSLVKSLLTKLEEKHTI